MLIQIIGGGAKDVCLRQAQKDAPPVGASPLPLGTGTALRADAANLYFRK